MASETEVANIYATIGAQVDGFTKAFTSMSSSIAGVVGLLGAIGVAGYSIYDLGSKSIDAASEQQQADSLLSNTLANLSIKYSDVGSSLSEYFDKLQALTGFQNSDLENSFTKLLQITGNVATSMKDLSIATDLARGLNIDLSSASQMVGRVQEGNIGLLKRLIPGLNEANGATKNLSIIQAKFAGDGAAYMDTYAGAQARLTNSIHSLAVAFGNDLMPYAEKALDIFTKLITFANDLVTSWDRMPSSIKGFVETLLLVVSGGAAAYGILMGISNLLMAMVPAIEMVSGTMLLWVGAIAAVGASIAWVSQNWSKLKDLVVEVVDGILSYIMSWGIKLDETLSRIFGNTSVGEFFKKDALEGIAAMNSLDDASAKAASNANTAWTSLGDSTKNVVNSMGNTFATLYNKYHLTMTKISNDAKVNGQQMGDFWSSLFSGMGNIAHTFANTFASDFASSFKLFEDGTFDIGQAFAAAIDAMVQKILESGILDLLSLIFTGSGGGLVAGLFSGTSSGSSTSGVQKFASGGIVTSPTLALVGEAGPEIITPLSQLQNNKGGGGGDTNYNINSIVIPSLATMTDSNTLRNTLRNLGTSMKRQGLSA